MEGIKRIFVNSWPICVMIALDLAGTTVEHFP
jgi:hypothetical protein